jgi:membrane protein DedA with SNARE-associated domain/membrane-associated phospholipid phosphatase
MEFKSLIDYTHQVVQFVQIHPYWGIFFAFMIAFIESSPIFGTIFPGAVTMTVVGALMGSHALPIVWTLLWCSLAAFLGDLLGYVLGRHYKEKLKRVWPFKKYPHWLRHGESFIAKHGGKSIVIGRFFGPMRSTVPLVAGILNLAPLRFVLAAIPSALLWAIVYTLPGILLGIFSVTLPAGEATKFLVFGVMTAAIIWGVFWILQYLTELFFYGLKRISSRLWQVMHQKQHLQCIIRLIGRQQSGYDYRPFFFTVLIIICSLIFLCMFFSTLYQNILTELNEPLFYLFQSLHTPILTNIAILLTTLGDKIVLTAAGIVMSLYLYCTGHKRACYHVCLTMLLFFLVVGLFKSMFYFPRPQGLVNVAKSSTFPSGHTAYSVCFFGWITFLGTRAVRRSWRWMIQTKTVLLIGLIAVSRVYLGAHWLTDVIGGAALGSIILLITMISYYRKSATKVSWLSFTSITFFAVLIPWVSICYYHFDTYKRSYQLFWQPKTTASKVWWTTGIVFSEAYRLNRFADPIQPLNFQWNASGQTIMNLLTQQGWISPIENKMALFIYRFQDVQPEHHLPLWPVLYHGQKPAIILIKSLPKTQTILVFRAWKSQLSLNDTAVRDIFIGNVTYQLPPLHTWAFKPIYLQTVNGIPALAVLLSNIRPFVDYQVIRVSADTADKKLKHLKWNNQAALIRQRSFKPH